MKKIKDLHVHDRPREKLSYNGAESLSDEELLQAIIGSGSRTACVQTLSEQVLRVVNENNSNLEPKMLSSIPGIGEAKATLICAALEFARRRIRPYGVRIREARDVYPLVKHFADKKQEHFICLSLNGAHEVIATRVVTMGLVNSAPVHPREVFADPITDRAAAVILAHNHPSGQLSESPEDIRATNMLVEAGKLIGIKVLDHIVFTTCGYISMAEKGVTSFQR